MTSWRTVRFHLENILRMKIPPTLSVLGRCWSLPRTSTPGWPPPRRQTPSLVCACLGDAGACQEHLLPDGLHLPGRLHLSSVRHSPLSRRGQHRERELLPGRGGHHLVPREEEGQASSRGEADG